MSDYGDDVSVDESVASLLQEERELEEKQKRLYKDDNTEEEKPDNEISVKDKYELYEKFKGVIFQNASNNKLYVLQIKKS
tara:strand:+ start:344 stop:583 length:240 start_codon:yes stop_codon:yes gene_type:complete